MIEEDKEESEAIERSISNGLGFNKEELAGMEERGKEIAESQRGRGPNNMACDISTIEGQWEIQLNGNEAIGEDNYEVTFLKSLGLMGVMVTITRLE